MVALANLHFPQLLRVTIYGRPTDHLLHVFGKSWIILYLIWVVTSFIDFIAMVLDANDKTNKDKRDDQLIVFFRDFVKAVIYIIGLLLIMKIGFGVDIGALLTGLSIVGAALALAAKESIENLIASFIIFFDKPFFTGDIVKLTNVSGTVEQIGLRSTRIRTADQTLVTVPNKQMVDTVVDNWSMRDSRRTELKIELDHEGNEEQIRQFMELVQALLEKKNSDISKHSVYITDYNRSCIMVTIEYFSQFTEQDRYSQLKQQVIVEIREALRLGHLKLATAGHDINIYNADSGNAGKINSQIL
jgi:MscS family membrane protein